MTAVGIFEELRFVIELVIAEEIFVHYVAKKKDCFLQKKVLGWAVFLIGAVFWAWVRAEALDSESGIFDSIVNISWYISLSLLTLIHLRSLYTLNVSDTLFLGIAAYSLQHIEYVLVNETLALGVWPVLTEYLILYIFICAVSYFLLCLLAVKIFAGKLQSWDGVIFEDNWGNVLFFSLMFIVLLYSAFMCQNIFLEGSKTEGVVNYQGAISDFFNCMLVLVVQYSIFRITTLNREKEIVNHLLYERKRQYNLSKENIDIINRKCHDLKHQIGALRHARGEELEHYIDEVEGSIMIYDMVLETDNEVLNTILSEKSLYCEKHEITLSCIVDASHMDFMSTLDIYALLGNALDNAIECVSRYKDKEKRVISLNISAKDSFLCIQTNNYYEGTMKMAAGLPVSTKTRNKEYHGFGMKSMKQLAEKYGGSMYTKLEDGIFTLQIVLPMPQEFLRLLKEAEKSRKNQMAQNI